MITPILQRARSANLGDPYPRARDHLARFGGCSWPGIAADLASAGSTLGSELRKGLAALQVWVSAAAQNESGGMRLKRGLLRNRVVSFELELYRFAQYAIGKMSRARPCPSGCGVHSALRQIPVYFLSEGTNPSPSA